MLIPKLLLIIAENNVSEAMDADTVTLDQENMPHNLHRKTQLKLVRQDFIFENIGKLMCLTESCGAFFFQYQCFT